MISVLDVLTIFVSGFIAAKVCDYVHGLLYIWNQSQI